MTEMNLNKSVLTVYLFNGQCAEILLTVFNIFKFFINYLFATEEMFEKSQTGYKQFNRTGDVSDF